MHKSYMHNSFSNQKWNWGGKRNAYLLNIACANSLEFSWWGISCGDFFPERLMLDSNVGYIDISFIWFCREIKYDYYCLTKISEHMKYYSWTLYISFRIQRRQVKESRKSDWRCFEKYRHLFLASVIVCLSFVALNLQRRV